MKKFFVAVALILCTLSGIASREQTAIKFDDGFTWIECHNFSTSENSKPVTYWVPEFSFRVWGTAVQNSGFRLVLKQEGKQVYEVTGDMYPVKYDKTPGSTIVGFWRDKDRIKATGVLTAEFYFTDGLTNKETLAKTLKVDVRMVTRTSASVGHRDPDAPAFYVNRHSEVLSNILYFRDVEVPSYTQFPNISYFTERRVELVMNYCDSETFSGPALGRILVEVDGKPVEMSVPNNTMIQDKMGLGEVAGHYSVEHSDRDADPYFKSGPYYRERIGFARRSFHMPFEWGEKLPNRAQGYVFTTAHPGDWKVTWLVDRKPVRIFRFKVTPDGLPVPHEEQANGLNLAPNAILVDTEIPAGGGEFDGRLTNQFVSQSAFYGRPWATAKMKTAAAAVPTKGKPFPVSSAKK